MQILRGFDCKRQSTKVPNKYIFCNLFVSPLRPKVPCQGSSNTKEGKYNEQPEEPIHKAEFLVKDIAHPMDRATAGILLCRFRQRLLIECFSHGCSFASEVPVSLPSNITAKDPIPMLHDHLDVCDWSWLKWQFPIGC